MSDYLRERGVPDVNGRCSEEAALNAYFRPPLWERGKRGAEGMRPIAPHQP